MSQSAENPSSISIPATRAGGLGQNRVGVVGVYQPPLKAQVVIAGASAKVAWEATHFVYTGQQIMADQRCYRTTVGMPLGGSDLGDVSFDQTQSPLLNGQPWPENTAILDGDGGMLRILDGPDISAAWEMRVVAWQPDPAHATSANVELLPLKMPREFLKPGDVRHVPLAVGGVVNVGPAKAEVLAVEGGTKLHPPRIIFRLSLLH